MTMEYMYSVTKTESDAINWCQVNQLLNLDPLCTSCGGEMVFSGSVYRCNKSKCRTIVSLTSGTIFDRSRHPIKSLVLLIYFWICEINVTRTAFQLKMSPASISKWFLKLRNYAEYFYFLKNNNPIGGPKNIVEIDEALVVKRKYHKGRILKYQQWVFGGIVRGQKTELFVEFIPNRSRETLKEIISRRIAPGSTIISDCWRAYSNLPEQLPQYNFQHFSVNHSKNFVDPNNSYVHTQSIEGFWSYLKSKLRQRGTNKGNNLDSYFAEILYRRKYFQNDDQLFDLFLKDICEYL